VEFVDVAETQPQEVQLPLRSETPTAIRNNTGGKVGEKSLSAPPDK